MKQNQEESIIKRIITSPVFVTIALILLTILISIILAWYLGRLLEGAIK